MILKFETKPSRSELANFIRQQIESKELLPGAQLPTTTDIANIAGVSSHTVRLAMAKLENEGLIKSTPGRGTFVLDNAQVANPQFIREHSNQPLTKLRSIAIMGAVSSDLELPDRYKADSVSGLLKEAQELLLIAEVFPYQLRDCTVEQIFQQIKLFGCEGVLWPGPIAGEREKILSLIEMGIPVIATRRADMADWIPSVAADFQNGGLVVGEYFCKNGCSSTALVLNRPHCDLPLSMQDGLPNGLKSGMENAFEVNGRSIGEHFSVLRFEGYSRQASEKIFAAIKDFGPDCGIVFCNSFQFVNFICDLGETAKNYIQCHKCVVLSNSSAIGKCYSIIAGLDFCFLLDPFEEVAKVAVHKLANQVQGSTINTKSLVQMEFKRSGELQQERNVRANG